MKKITFILITILGISLTLNAKDNCTVKDGITAEIAYGYALVEASESGQAGVRVKVTAPQKTYATVYVWVNAIDRKTKCIKDTRKIQINLYNQDSNSNGETFKNLTPGVHYEVSIDRASCN